MSIIIDYVRPIYDFMFASRERAIMSLWYLAIVIIMGFVLASGPAVIFELSTDPSGPTPSQIMAFIILVITIMSITYWFFIALLSFLRPREEWPVFTKGAFGLLANLFLVPVIILIPVSIYIPVVYILFAALFAIFAIIYIFRYSKVAFFLKLVALAVLFLFLAPIIFLLAFSLFFLSLILSYVLILGLVVSYFIWAFFVVYFLFTPFKIATDYTNRYIQLPRFKPLLVNLMIIFILNIVVVVPMTGLYLMFNSILQPPAGVGILIGVGLLILLFFTNIISFLLLFWFGKRNLEKYHQVYIFHLLILLYFAIFIIKFLFVDFEGAPLSLYSAVINTIMALILTFFAIRKIAVLVTPKQTETGYKSRFNPRTWSYTLFFTTTLYYLVVKGLNFVGVFNEEISTTFDLTFTYFVFFAPLAYLAFFLYEKFESGTER
ncbi:MAG: hypothetical protein ACFFC7_06505 [Candidatus Hermodarchaeota archaeon]